MTENEVREIADMQKHIDTLLPMIASLNEIAKGEKKDPKYVSFCLIEGLVEEAYGNISKKLLDLLTLTEVLNALPAEIGRYELTITRYFDPEAEQLMWSMTYECSADGTILPGCDINEADFEDGARKLYDWLTDNGHITESDNNALAHLMGDPVAEVDELIDSLTI